MEFPRGRFQSLLTRSVQGVVQSPNYDDFAQLMLSGSRTVPSISGRAPADSDRAELIIRGGGTQTAGGATTAAPPAKDGLAVAQGVEARTAAEGPSVRVAGSPPFQEAEA